MGAQVAFNFTFNFYQEVIETYLFMPNAACSLSIIDDDNNLYGSVEVVRSFEPFAKQLRQILKRAQGKENGFRSNYGIASQPVSKISKASAAPRGTIGAKGSVGSVTFGTDHDGNFVCPLCRNLFRSKVAADRHFKTIHSGISFACEMCIYTTKRKDELKKHLTKKHNLNSDIAKIVVDRAPQV